MAVVVNCIHYVVRSDFMAFNYVGVQLGSGLMLAKWLRPMFFPMIAVFSPFGLKVTGWPLCPKTLSEILKHAG